MLVAEHFSRRIVVQPAALSAASWIERSWSTLLTRAYPKTVLIWISFVLVVARMRRRAIWVWTFADSVP
jgi:hypothetical protein